VRMNKDKGVKNIHLSDRSLVMGMDGELSAQEFEFVRSHLEACWTCRARQRELEAAAIEFAQAYQESGPGAIPAADGPRALLKAQMGILARQEARWWQRRMGYRWIAGTAAGLLLAAFVADRMLSERPSPAVVLAAPNPALTPGAAVFEPPGQLCRESLPKNKNVPAALRRRVLSEYGVANAAEKAYEVDYLITPALGGSDDIHNLWPHSYANTEWNARVKDALEDRLHAMVCQGQLDLPTAQREIATNWIEAYKKYFHTDRPVTPEQTTRRD